MSEVQENTEAKLAAYIDGELEGADRAEIEKLLEQNPNYRRVIEQLRQTRDLVRVLPRESAPPELSEIFSRQLERSVLLNGIDEDNRKRFSLVRWPQLMMAAAVLLLTVGLGAIVYTVLPRGKPVLQVATSQSAPGASQPGRGVVMADDREADDSDIADSADKEKELKRRDLQLSSGGMGGGANGSFAALIPEGSAPEVGELAQNAYENPQVQSLLNSDQPAGDSEKFADKKQTNPEAALVMVVRCNDPQQLQKEVTSYFATNNIAWSAAPQEVPVTLNDAMARNSVAQTDEAPSQWQRLLSKKPATNDSPPAQTPTARQEQARAPRAQANAARSLEVSPTTRASNSDATSGLRQQDRAQYSAREAQNQQGQSNAMLLPVDTVYVARRVTQRQVQELNLALAGRADVKRSQITLRGAVERSTARSQAEGEQAQQQASKDANTPTPALHPARQAAASPDAKDVEQKVAAAPSQVAGPPADAKTEGAKGSEFSEAAATSNPATAPSENSAVSNSNVVAGYRYFRNRSITPTTQPAPAEARPEPQTRPADSLAAALADQPVDVVIVVQKDSSNPSQATSPATQPAATQPVQQ